MRTATLPTAVKAATNPYLRSTAAAPPEEKIDKPLRLLRRTLVALVLLLTFEGLFRKLEPNKIGVAIFLFKDLVILFMGLQLVTRHRLPPAVNFLTISYVLTCFFFLPNILMTGSHDPLLAAFGAKEYLLYPIVGLGVFVVFQNSSMDEVTRFCRFVAFLMIPSGLVAMLQTQISPNNWLNMSVDGQSLEDFSSAGHLRVSSTFSFVSQFCAFLNMQMFMCFMALYRLDRLKGIWRLVYLAPIPLLVICSYLTGSRGAVIGNTAVLAIAVILACLRFELGKIVRFVWIAGLIALVVVAFQYFYPSLMATYTVREKGQAFGVSNEIWGRVYEAFFGWISSTDTVPFFGNGLGIMSNGSAELSPYARTFRLEGWTETDFASTLFEGGPYLIFVWYAFRYYIIFTTTRRFLFQTKKEYFLAGAFCQGYVILVGLTGTLGIQPPIAIWWWLGVGLSTILWWRSVHPLPGEAVAEARPAWKIRRGVHTLDAGPGPEKVPTKPRAAQPPPEPAQPATPPAKSGPVPRPLRGRSPYADKLHGQK